MAAPSRRLSRLVALCASAAAIALALAALQGRAPEAGAAAFAITIQLTPAQVSPPPLTTASGFAQIILETETNEVRFAFTLFGVAPGEVTGVHLHRGFSGEEGPVARTLSAGGVLAGSGRFTLSREEAALLLVGGFYIDVHSRTYPGGLLRGQVLPPGVQPATPTPTPTATPTPAPTSTPAPAAEPSAGNGAGSARGAITPPSTGDGGLK